KVVTRRRFLQGAMTLALLERVDPRTALARAEQAGPSGAGTPPGDASVSQFVDVFVGTGGHGHTFPGATVPWGMVQLSPDTHTHGWDACSGYHEGDGSIMGFSHTHLSGTGGLPDELYYSRYDAAARGKHLAADVVAHPGKGYRSRYDKASEKGSPGYYTVHLTDHDILAELTATARAGLHRYTFKKSGSGHLLVDLAHGYRDGVDKPCLVSDAELKVIGHDTLVGGRRVHEWANGRYIYFAMKVSRPFARAELYSDDKALASATK